MARPDPEFDLTGLVETGAITTHQHDLLRMTTERIKERDFNHKRVWFLHALDVMAVQNCIAQGHFEAWVRTLPFSRTRAFAWARAARMITEYITATGGPNLGLLPPMSSTIACELAEDGVDPGIRVEFLERLITGDKITRAELHAALGKGQPESVPDAEPEPDPVLEEEPPKREPTPAMERFAKRLMAKDRRFILDIARAGEIHLLLNALSWADATRAGIGERDLDDDEADRIDEKVADAMREMPKVKLPEMGELGNDDDETAIAAQKKIIH